ncbi:putative aldouronate transport system permease protein [Bifidobacterium bohemicum]|uniref:ABC transporter, permease protein n=1 Tax=Bifidobacterium bohemicum DSM 22767 TaxID=1437606 RepID=A0A086ZDW6_9BIFI|nr:carbohydrate ABC transporter permease [Bifidobacterium bohemicum]KFI44716.1 ABC transporter, permease protein [Bifidobacterium bohemicum DSM 22767]SCC18259.1 putative aldouronate transport system permease protein [Bifidobacterium bohemicum]
MNNGTTKSPAVSAKRVADAVPWNKHVHQRRNASDWVADILIWALIILIVLVVLYPLWFVVIASISDQHLVSNGSVTVWPKGLTFAGYVRVFQDSRIWTGYRNTIIYSVLGTILNLVVTLPAAFALARVEWKPRRVILFLFTFTMYFAGGLVPNYLLYKQLGLLDNWLVFILPGAVSVWNLIIARSFFETSIPEDLHDAAQIDGLNYFGYFMKIVIPLSSAIIAVIGLYYFVGHWNDYFTGLIYIRESGLQPLQNVLRDILLANQTNQLGTGSGGQNALQNQQIADQIKYGVIMVSTLPLLVIYPFLQKYFDKGVMIGAVKG